MDGILIAIGALSFLAAYYLQKKYNHVRYFKTKVVLASLALITVIINTPVIGNFMYEGWTFLFCMNAAIFAVDETRKS